MAERFSHLPNELALLVAQHAAYEHIVRSASWVATLCLVCKSFRRVVTPILYEVITLDPLDLAMYQRFVSTSDSPETPLLLTRSLVVSLSNVPLRFYHNNETVFASLAPALAKITSFTGTTQALGRLVQCIDGLRLRSAYLVDVTDSWRLPILATIMPVIDTLSKLHIAYELGSPSLYAMSSSNVEYLIVDVLQGLLGIDGAFDIGQEAASLTASAPRLRRVLFRPRFQMESTTHRVSERLIEWAELQRDPRVWIDDTFVPIPHNDDPQVLTLWDDLDRADAMQGDSLWLRGRQIWHPTARRRDEVRVPQGNGEAMSVDEDGY